MLASASAPIGLPNLTDGWIDVFFSSLVGVTAGTQYFLAFYSPAQFYNTFQVGGQTGNAYTGGDGYYNFSTSVSAPYTQLDADVAFREYATLQTSTTPPATTTPEPASAVLVLSGLTVFGVAARRRRARA